MIDGGQITPSVLIVDPGLDLAVVRQLGRKIPSFMKDTQDLNFLVPVSGLRVHAVEKGVGMSGDGAKFAGQIGNQVAPDPVHPRIDDQPVCRRFNLVHKPVGCRRRGHASEVAPDLDKVVLGGGRPDHFSMGVNHIVGGLRP
jgi:hypothetical protein